MLAPSAAVHLVANPVDFEALGAAPSDLSELEELPHRS